MNYILFDDDRRNHLLPLTFTRPVAEIRIGILTIHEKWKKYIDTTFSFLTEDYLSTKYTLQTSSDNVLINGSLIPNNEIVKAIGTLKPGNYLAKEGVVLAARLSEGFKADFYLHLHAEINNRVEYTGDIFKINNPWDIFSKNGEALNADFELLTKGRKSAQISKTNNILGAEKIFLEEGAHVEFATLNASTGPIYIGKDAEVMEGSIVRGSLALCEGSALKLGTKIYGPTTIGPHSKVGGEVNNTVIFGYSNKAHDGFLGNAVLGEWCNIGADSNNSNLKNNYSEVKLWNYVKERFMPTGLQFCGLIMGDHSKCGINTMFNTGTVIGVSANIFGAGYPRNFIPSFSWGGAQGMAVYPLNKAVETAQLVFARRGIEFNKIEADIFAHVFDITDKYRRF